jgi:hypothetical protein
MVDALNAHLGFAPSGLSGMLAPTGHHPGGDHHPLPGAAAQAPEAGDPVAIVPGTAQEA